MMTLVKLPRTLVNEILHHAQMEPEQEICGLIGKNQQNEFFCYPMRNVAQNPKTEFLIDAEQQAEVFQILMSTGQALFAIYHSHLNVEATPSLRDQQIAYYPNTVYLIISLNTRGVLQIRGYYLQNHIFNEVQLEI